MRLIGALRQLKKQREQLQAKIGQLDDAIAALEGLSGKGAAPAKAVKALAVAKPAKRKRRMSAAARKRIADAQKRRWAAYRAKQAAK
jgi:hypothetical protein